MWGRGVRRGGGGRGFVNDKGRVDDDGGRGGHLDADQSLPGTGLQVTSAPLYLAPLPSCCPSQTCRMLPTPVCVDD